MRSLLTISIFICCSICTHAQALIIDSTRFITGIHPGVVIDYAIPTADKGIFFVGQTYSNPGGIIPYFFDTLNYNVLIGKIDSNRKISWIKVYGGSQNDVAVSACQTSDGGFAVLAGTASDDGSVTGYKGEDDLWLLKIDGSGNLLWENTYGSTSQDEPVSLAATADNGFILLGVTYGSDGDVPFHYGDSWSDDWLLIKTDSLGNKQWSKDLGGTGDEGLTGSVLSVDNDYYILSSSNSTDHDCTDTAWHPGAHTSNDYYILKIDTGGNVVWDSSYGGTSDDDIYDALFDARDSSFVMIGNTSSYNYMVTGFQGGCQTDMWVVKVNKVGKLLWEKDLGSVQIEKATGVCETKGGGYMVYGNTQHYPYCYDSAIDHIGYVNCWLFVLDSGGNTLDNKVFGGIVAEYPSSIVPALNGYAAFGTSSSLVFTEGATYGNFDSTGGTFVSYIDYWPLTVNNLTKASETMTVFPNPAENNINIQLPEETGRLLIINSFGQSVYKQEIPTTVNIQNVQVSGWPDGIYLIVWQGENGEVITKKLIKN